MNKFQSKLKVRKVAKKINACVIRLITGKEAKTEFLAKATKAITRWQYLFPFYILYSTLKK